MSGDYPNYSNIKIYQNTEESPGDVRRLVLTQTPVEDHQQTLERNSEGSINNNNNNNNNNNKFQLTTEWK